MSDVFLSYSRKDVAFVHRVHQALVSLGREMWVDWRDVPPTSEWMREIFAGIEAADNFVFVVSPDSVTSAVCNTEIGHAVSQNKRLIPIVYRPVESEDIPPNLAKIQWISFAEPSEFQLAFASLVQALDSDMQWVRTHTRLLMRAAEWEQRRQDTSFLLRGADLRDAVEWLAQAPMIPEPKPSSLQLEYLRASREWEEGEISRLNKLIEEKDRQHQKAISRQLSAQSELVLRDDPGQLELAALLAVESARRCPLFENNQAMRQVSALLPRTIGQLSLEGSVDAVWFNADQRSLFIRSKDTVRLFDPISGKELELPINSTFDVDSACSSDGRRAIWRGAEYGGLLGVLILHGDSGNIVARLNDRSMVNSVAWSPDGRHIVTGSQDGVAQVFETQSWKEVSRLTHRDAISAVAFSPDGCRVLTGSLDRTARLFDANSGREKLVVRHHDFVESVAFSPDGRLVASGSWDKTARITEVATGKEMVRLCFDSYVQAVAFSANGFYLAAGSLNGKTQVCETQFLGELFRLKHESIVNTVKFSPDGKYVATACEGVVRVFDLRDGTEISRLSHSDRIVSLALSREGHLVATACKDKTARVFHVKGGKEVLSLNHEEEIRSVALSEDCRLIATGVTRPAAPGP